MRVDKARNRETVMAAAARLFAAAEDPDEVSMDAVAVAAGVGKGTVFRGFGDRRALVRELWDETLARFDAENPAAGSTPRERVLDLLLRTWRFKREHRVLGLALERAGEGSPYATAGYDRWHTTLVELLAEVPGEREFLAHALLAAVRSDLVEHLRSLPDEEVQAGLRRLVDGVVRPG